jgi:hypothetical protein
MLAVIFVLSGISTLGHGQSSATGALVPNLVSFAGTLKDSGGHPVKSVTGVTFSLYAQEEGGAPLWLETQNVEPDASGRYSVQLGAASAHGLPAQIFTSGEARWLEVQLAGEPEQPRILLVAVPYAMKAADAETVGGLPPSAFMLATPPAPNGMIAVSAAPAAATLSPSLSGSGTTDYLPLWTSSSALGSSILFQTGSGSAAKIGINTTTPAAMLDVKGSTTIRSLLNLPATATATASAGADSNQIGFVASTYNSGTKTAANQVFRFMAEPVGNNTGSPAATLNLLFGTPPTVPAETGLKISSKGVITFAGGQTFPGTGTITQVSADVGLVGGGTTGRVALGVDSSVVPFLASMNEFSSTQYALSGTSAGFVGESSSSYGVYGSSTSSDGTVGISSTATGLRGESDSGYGVYGSSSSSYGVAGVTNNGNGVYGQVNVAPQAGVVGRQQDSSGNWGVYAFGNIGATGTKSSVVSVDNGTRQVALYAVESPGVWFEDYGSARLVSGVATVNIDPGFAQTVNTGVQYHVFLTPDADCEGLYVTARTATSFEVRELHQGKSNVAFDYRIIAPRRGYETKRLADVTSATPRAAIETAGPAHVGSAPGPATIK